MAVESGGDKKLTSSLLQDLQEYVHINQRNEILEDLGPESSTKLKQFKNFKKYQSLGFFTDKEDIKLFREFSKEEPKLNSITTQGHQHVGNPMEFATNGPNGFSPDQYVVALGNQHGGTFLSPAQLGEFLALGQSNAGPMRQRPQAPGRPFSSQPRQQQIQRYPPNPLKDVPGGFLYCDICHSSATTHTTWQCPE